MPFQWKRDALEPVIIFIFLKSNNNNELLICFNKQFKTEITPTLLVSIRGLKKKCLMKIFFSFFFFAAAGRTPSAHTFCCCRMMLRNQNFKSDYLAIYCFFCSYMNKWKSYNLVIYYPNIRVYTLIRVLSVIHRIIMCQKGGSIFVKQQIVWRYVIFAYWIIGCCSVKIASVSWITLQSIDL